MLNLMYKKLAVFLIVFLLSACAKNSSDNDAIFKPYTTQYTTVDCDEIGPELKIDENVECGWFTVPESRYNENNTNEITLAILTLKSSSKTPDPDPIVYIHGGPGGLALKIADKLAPIFEDARNSRDIILVDQRGSGYTVPYLGCPEILEQKLNRIHLISEDVSAELPADTSINVCKDRLVERGIDLASYSTIENTTDIDDLRKVLKINQWNLYGVSYGTRIAQTMMQHYPGGIRSVILDSAVPQKSSLLDVSDTVRKYNLLLEILDNCVIDTYCNSEYPNIDERFWERISFLEKQSTVVPINVPELNLSANFRFTASNLIEFVNNMIDENNIEELPKKVTFLLESQFPEIKGELEEVVLGSLEEPLISHGAFFSIMCADEFKKPYDKTIIDIQDIPEVYKQDWRDVYGGADIGCEEWPFSKIYGLERSSVVSGIPTLILAGKYDVRTTTNTAQDIKNYLSNATYVEFPKDGHGVLVNACSQTIRDIFYDNPLAGPETACLATIDASTTFTKPGVKIIEHPTLELPNPFQELRQK